jgi:UDP-N-acetylmuramoyl-tripeptide--D-alanyl-D-alanine ligase
MSMTSWTSAEAAAAVGGTASGPAFEATGVSIDSRTVKPGDLFVALSGPSFDGHDFVARALEAGAAGALVSRRPEGVGAAAPLVTCADTFAGLEGLGGAARQRAEARIVAVTGSVGKTSTKEALRHALGSLAPTFATEGSLNNHWGVPLSLARLPRDAAYGVFELGMNHAGELGPLSRQVRPDVAVITNVEAVHLEHFASVEAIADAKAEIFEGMSPRGIAVLNRDNAHFERLAAAARAQGLGQVLSFGAGEGSDARLIDCALEATSSAVIARIRGERLEYRVSTPGRHHVINSLGLLLAVGALGGDVAEAARSLSRIPAIKGRGQRKRVELPGGALTLIDESYNASPASVAATLQVLGWTPPAPGGRRIAILGDMLELGSRSPELHAGLAQAVEEAGIDLVFCSGPNMRHLFEALPASRRGAYAPDSATLAPVVAGAVRAGDVLTVKGSKGSLMGRVIDAVAALGPARPTEMPAAPAAAGR